MKITKLILLLAFFMPLGAKCQVIKSRLDVATGISAREYLHIGVKYQYTDLTQVGFYFGGDLELEDEKITTYCLDHMIHFGKLSYYSNRAVWYARQGITYSVNLEDAQRTRKFTYINIGLGREFAVNNWLGFNADLGFIWQLREVTEDNQRVKIDNYRYIMPLARIQAFISF